jgi:hypothetical protein
MYLEKFAREVLGLANIGLKVFKNSVYADGGVMLVSVSDEKSSDFTDFAESRHVYETGSGSRSSEGKIMVLGVLNGGR